ncbi:hypothetical protein ACFFSH_38205 [Streptomyces filamentosus]|uniref:Uncharacterized protein n=1 Tax=Streptomyces filamentosus TaxID=67294 RepID=A0A919EQC3_STRFL|nr:hypothetical protein [Streptomyces filamentosus]GHG14938.1 hypothetical protein GCM10017667_55510 [Streptomyces filamentosus]
MTDQTDTTPAEAQEIEASGHYLTATLCGQELQVMPAGAWRQSTMRILRSGDMDAFLEDVLSPESYDVYLDLDPTNDDLNAFMEEVDSAGGEPRGKSSGPSRSSRSTRKR